MANLDSICILTPGARKSMCKGFDTTFPNLFLLKAEKDGLITWVGKCSDVLIPLAFKAPAVAVDDQGNFTISFPLPDWATGDGTFQHQTAKSIAAKAVTLIGGHKKWQKDTSDNLTFKSITAYASLKKPRFQRIFSLLQIRQNQIE